MHNLNRVYFYTATLVAMVGTAMAVTPQAPVVASSAATTPTAAATSQPPSSVRIDDGDPAVIYSRGNDLIPDWFSFLPTLENYNNTEHSSRFIREGGPIPGVGVVINFSGTGITWIGKKGPEYGVASYSIDGGPPQTVDNYSAKRIPQNANVTISGLTSESHVLSISLLDQKNAASSDYWQTIDAFDVQGSALLASQGTVVGFGSPELQFSGKWDGGLVSDLSDLSGGHYWSKKANSSVSWTFVGSLIEVFGRPDYENGYMDVYIDGSSEPVASINGHWGSVDDDTLNSYLLFAKKLAPGQHTIKIVVAGKHDKSARDNYVQIDQLVAFQ
jgi:hypothetical protein